MHAPLRSALVFSLAAVLLVCLASCSNNSTTMNPPPPISQHLYVGDDQTPGKVAVFALPLTNSSTPDVVLSTAPILPSSLAVDANGNLATGDFSANLAVFNAPITGSTPAAAAFKNGTGPNVGEVVFNSAGDLFATTIGNSINLFTHPLTSTSTPSKVITDVSLTTVVGAVLDSNNNLIVGNQPNLGGSNLVVFAPPYTAAPIVTAEIFGTSYRHMAITSTQLFAMSSVVSMSRVDVYNLPITAASVPAFSITSGVVGGANSPQAVAVDSNGNLYVGNISKGTILVYNPPFSAASSPSLTISASAAVQGIAIGK